LDLSGTNINFVVKNAADVIQTVFTNATNANGISIYNFTQSVAGVYTVTASNATPCLNNSTTVTFAGSAASIVVTVNNSSPRINGNVTINATVRDSSGVRSGYLGTGAITFLANGIEFASVTLTSGVASTTYTKATAGTVTLTAFYNATLQNTTTVTFTPAPLPALNVSASPATVTAGMPTDVLFSVTGNGTAIDNATVTLSGVATANATQIPADSLL